MYVTELIDTLGGVKGRVAFLLAGRKAHSAPTFDQEIPIKDFGERIMRSLELLIKIEQGENHQLARR
jgi:hypothetical protein